MKVPRRQFLHLAASAAVLPTISRIATAQAYPSRPIRLVIPFPPGGAFDAVGRPWADKMKHLLGTVVVENIGGGSGSLGAVAVARAQPDGYTTLLGGTRSDPRIWRSRCRRWSFTTFRPDPDPFRSSPISRHFQSWLACLKGAKAGSGLAFDYVA